MPKEARIEFDVEGDRTDRPPKDTSHPLYSENPLVGQNKQLIALLAALLESSSQVTANGIRSKDRCWDCALTFDHSGPNKCHCICHEARKYLTELSNG